ncbi:MAG: HIT family hydrolase [Phycisphaerae bacterium]|nr:HIT family hydrolase [Phycisphaerae bacterium]
MLAPMLYVNRHASGTTRMNHRALWAPWRLAYLQDCDEAREDADRTAEIQHFLEAYWAAPADDEANFVVHRSDRGMILLNRYPYSNGHLLVALGEGRPGILDYDTTDRAAFWALAERAADLLQRALKPHGINFGINQGEAAGAGIPGHLHGHLVPRWEGDTNFMTVTGGTRVIPSSLEDMTGLLRTTDREI